jgi:hypothetical protein
MADGHDRAVIAMGGIAIDQQVATTLRPHVAQSYRSELSNSRSRHGNLTLHYPHYGSNPDHGLLWHVTDRALLEVLCKLRLLKDTSPVALR